MIKKNIGKNIKIAITLSVLFISVMLSGAVVTNCVVGRYATYDELNQRWRLELPSDLEAVFFLNGVNSNSEVRYSVFVTENRPEEVLKNFSQERYSEFEYNVERKILLRCGTCNTPQTILPRSIPREYAPWFAKNTPWDDCSYLSPTGWDRPYYWLHINGLSWVDSQGTPRKCMNSNLYAMFFPYASRLVGYAWINTYMFVFVQQIFNPR